MVPYKYVYVYIDFEGKEKGKGENKTLCLNPSLGPEIGGREGKDFYIFKTIFLNGTSWAEGSGRVFCLSQPFLLFIQKTFIDYLQCPAVS